MTQSNTLCAICGVQLPETRIKMMAKTCSNQCSKLRRDELIKAKKKREIIHYNCIACNTQLTPKQLNYGSKYCSKTCQSELINKHYAESNGERLGLATGTIGALNELRVCADLIIRGYDVFRSVSPNATCDMAILRNKILTRVEVTTGTIGYGGKLSFPAHDESRYDLLAVVLRSGEIRYAPPFPELARHNHFRASR